ncbi:MAG: hypothetical protein ABI620_10105 [Chloroflexota bacterium]
MTDQPDPDTEAESAGEAQDLDPTESHRTKQRRLLFAIVVTVFGLVIVIASPESTQAGVLVALLGLLLGVSGL